MTIQKDFFAACQRGDFATVKAMFTSYSIQVNRTNDKGMTPLIIVAQKGYTDIALLLLSHPNIDVNHKTKLSNTALMLAAQNGHTPIALALLATPGIQAAYRDEASYSALTLASINGHFAIVKALLDFPEINPNQKTNIGRTILEFAVTQGHLEIVKALAPRVDAATLNLVCLNNRTPLMSAVQNNNFSMVDVLVKAGATLAVRNRIYSTALMIASHLNFQEITFRLLSSMPPEQILAMRADPDPLNPALFNQGAEEVHLVTPKLKAEGLECIRQVNDIRADLFRTIWTFQSHSSIPADVLANILFDLVPKWYHHRLDEEINKITQKVLQKKMTNVPNITNELHSVNKQLTDIKISSPTELSAEPVIFSQSKKRTAPSEAVSAPEATHRCKTSYLI